MSINKDQEEFMSEPKLKFTPGETVRLVAGVKRMLLRIADPLELVWWVVDPDAVTHTDRPIHTVSVSEIKGPWREPLKAEFECQWAQYGETTIVYPLTCAVNLFIGKRTKVTIEEIV